ncbi:ATP-binding protein [uncultured Lutibacter sp.]|uniref:PAS domain-containing sensor histidine kinase n=1 Tax=uncultured Lutibacter sp. TaxID=437739 RepID=UPI00262A0E3A|nr:ATP-binding protein [uncultured Lutibacter sp.]
MSFSNQHIFNILFEAIPEGAIIANDKQHIIAANSSAEEIFGYKKGELINQPLNILIPSKYQLNHKTHFSNFLKNKTIRKINYDLNFYGITKSKKEFPLEIGLNPFEIDEKLFIIALIIDVTKRKETDKKIKNINIKLEKTVKEKTAELKNKIKQLTEVNISLKREIKKRIEGEAEIKNALQKEQELNSLKTKFLSLVSHEFKTPLSGILTSSMLLDKYKLSNQQDKRDKHIETITQKVHYLNDILNNFLSIESIDASNVNYKFTTFNLSKIVNEVVYNANMLLKSGQKINISSDTNDYVLYQDEKILELILSYLLYNSIKYSLENTTIDLDIYQDTESTIFKFIDEGIGIPEKDQKFIFNRYFRAENVLHIQGTGIGLNIVKSHLENLGGSISFESKENKGSIFIVKLPLIRTL